MRQSDSMNPNSWAYFHKQKLIRGATVQFRPKGNSMKGRIDSGALVTVEPVTELTELKEGDAVLVEVRGRDFLHLIKAFGRNGESVQIGNNRGFINGWTPRSRIYGKVTRVEP